MRFCPHAQLLEELVVVEYARAIRARGGCAPGVLDLGFLSSGAGLLRVQEAPPGSPCSPESVVVARLVEIWLHIEVINS